MEGAVPTAFWRAISSFIVFGLLSGCMHSKAPLLPVSEALDDPILTGRYVSASRGELIYWRVIRDGKGYRITNMGGKEKAIAATLHRFNDRFALLQIGPTRTGGTEPRYYYSLIHIADKYLLFDLIQCDTTIVKEMELEVEKATLLSCDVNSRDQLTTLAHRAAKQFYDSRNMVPVLKAATSSRTPRQ
jgi:hypothetical protein